MSQELLDLIFMFAAMSLLFTAGGLLWYVGSLMGDARSWWAEWRRQREYLAVLRSLNRSTNRIRHW